MKVWALAKHEIEAQNMMDVPHVIISVHSPGQPQAQPKVNAYTQEVLFLCFHDLDSAPQGLAFEQVYGKPRLFDLEDALAVVALLYRYELDGVICQCEAGQSRSAGLAAAISKFFTDNDSMFFMGTGIYGGPRYTPNRFIYSLLLSTLHAVGPRWKNEGLVKDSARVLWSQCKLGEEESEKMLIEHCSHELAREPHMWPTIREQQVHLLHSAVWQAARAHDFDHCTMEAARKEVAAWPSERCRAYMVWYERAYQWEVFEGRARPKIDPHRYAQEFLGLPPPSALSAEDWMREEKRERWARTHAARKHFNAPMHHVQEVEARELDQPPASERESTTSTDQDHKQTKE